MVGYTPKEAQKNTDWKETDVQTTSSLTHRLLVRSDPAEGQTQVFYRFPDLVKKGNGSPLFSLSLILSKQPAPNQQTIREFIVRSVITINVQIGVTQSVLSALALEGLANPQRLFAKEIIYELGYKPDEVTDSFVLCRAMAAGTEGQAALSGGLNREQTLALLTALDGKPSGLSIQTSLIYRQRTNPVDVRLSGSWSAIYAFIRRQTDADMRLSAGQLRQAVEAMLEAAILVVSTPDGDSYSLPTEETYRSFMLQSRVILRPDPSSSTDGKRWYTLLGEPFSSFQLDYTTTFSGNYPATVSTKTDLSAVIGHALDGLNWNDYVQVIIDDSGSGSPPAPAPHRERAAKSLRQDRAMPDTVLHVAALQQSVQPVSLMMRPSQTEMAVARPLLTVVRPVSVKPITEQLALDDLRLELPGKVLSLPVIDGSKTFFWRDRLTPDKAWYAPSFDVVLPAPNVTPANSPFLFEFERTGVTSSGQTALRGSMRFTLRQVIRPETEGALVNAQLVKRQAVPLDNLTISVLVPFVNATDGQLRQQLFNATVSQTGDTITATIQLLNDWVRLCYGALTVAGFQAVPVQFRATYTFAGYVVVSKENIRLAYGGKSFQTPIVYSKQDALKLADQLYFDASRLSLVQAKTEVSFRAEPARNGQQKTSSAANRADAALAIRPTAAINANIFVSKPIISKPVVIRPELNLATQVLPIWQGITKYAVQTQARQESGSLLYPCDTFGQLYQEKVDGSPVAIGCQNALQLGQITYRLYAEIPDLQTSAYRVFRSLAQPGRFVVAPTQFCISRHAIDDDEAYRPLLTVHATIDPSVPANNRVNLSATLQPDLSPAQQRKLLQQLSERSPNPVIDYPVDIPVNSVETNWLVDRQIATQTQVDILDTNGPFIKALFVTDIAGWQLMRSVLESSGVVGSISFQLPDGLVLTANLLLKLNHIAGPWQTGPIEVRKGNNEIRLTNRIEQTVDINDVIVYDSQGIPQTIPVDISLPKAGVHVLPVGTGATSVLVDYVQPPGQQATLNETRTFIEDIYTNVIFIGLFDLPSYNLSRLDIEARVRDVDGVYKAQLTQAMPTADIPIVLSLTTYLSNRILQFRVTKHFISTPAETTPWLEWDMETDGPVNITPTLIGL